MLSPIFELTSSKANSILREYRIEFQNAPSAAISFQPISGISELSNFEKHILGFQGYLECSLLSFQLRFEGVETEIINSLGRPIGKNQSSLLDSIDLVKVASEFLNWKTHTTSSCPQLVHPVFGTEIFIGGMLIANASRNVLANALSYKISIDETIALV